MTTTAYLAFAAFLAVELAAIQRTLGNREHAKICLGAAAAIVLVALVDRPAA